MLLHKLQLVLMRETSCDLLLYESLELPDVVLDGTCINKRIGKKESFCCIDWLACLLLPETDLEDDGLYINHGRISVTVPVNYEGTAPYPRLHGLPIHGGK